MGNCNCCHDPILDGQDLHFLNLHQKCFLEREWRIAHDKCEMCGENNPVRESTKMCSKCLDSDTDYKGYKGPGQ